MTFELVRIGWPNTVAILALAALPMLSLGSVYGPRSQAELVQPTDAATICPQDGAVKFAALLPATLVE